MGNRGAKMSWSGSKTPYLQGTPTLYVEGDAQKTKPKTFLGGEGGGDLSSISWGVERFNPLVLLVNPTELK